MCTFIIFLYSFHGLPVLDFHKDECHYGDNGERILLQLVICRRCWCYRRWRNSILAHHFPHCNRYTNTRNQNEIIIFSNKWCAYLFLRWYHKFKQPFSTVSPIHLQIFVLHGLTPLSTLYLIKWRDETYTPIINGNVSIIANSSWNFLLGNPPMAVHVIWIAS